MVYVLDKDGNPLMPTGRYGHVRKLLKVKKAKRVSFRPFTIQLLYDSPGIIQPITLGIDPGRSNIGFTATTEKGKPLISGKAETRNKEIPKLMGERKEHRRKHRDTGRRDKRQRRAKANGTELQGKEIRRILPGCGTPVTCKGIRNKEARFSNRKQDDNWLTPTASQLLQSYVNLVKKTARYLPVIQVNLELNKFAFLRLDDPSVTGKDFQEGPLKGFGRDVKAAVWHLQDGECLLCGQGIEEYHHVRAVSRDGSETIKNRVGLCKSCHHKVHTDAAWANGLEKANAGMRKKYDAIGVLNQIIPALVKQLEALYPVVLTDGHATSMAREAFNISKDHHYDAYLIALADNEIKDVTLPDTCFQIRQFRRHDRQACKREMLNRNYIKDGKTVARNRHKAIGQIDSSLEEYVKAGGRTDNLTVRHRKKVMKDMGRILPGAQVLEEHRVKTVTKRSSGYYYFDDGTRVRINKIGKVRKNAGLVFVSNM